MDRRTIFPGWKLPAALVLPQLLVSLLYFYWPAGEAILQSLTQQDAFGTHVIFVWFSNFAAIFDDPLYLSSAWRTAVFCAAVSAIAMSLGLLLANFADRELRGRGFYRTLLIWPYAVAPAIAGVLWILLLNPQVGLIGAWLNRMGVAWDYRSSGSQALLVVTLASGWQQVSYSFIFYLAGLQAVPRTVLEAARLDGARGWRRFRTIVFPMLAPTTFFLLIANLTYAAFDSFGLIEAMTGGGPGQSTDTLMVKVYQDGIINADVGGSAAQSVVLMAAVVLLTAVQFRFLGRAEA